MGVGTTTSAAPRPEGPISRSPHLSSEAAHHPPGSTEQPSQEGLQLILADPKATALPQGYLVSISTPTSTPPFTQFSLNVTSKLCLQGARDAVSTG